MNTKQDTKKVIVVLGQTATGKSELAVRLARVFGGEVISADSRQVYKGLDIGAGKIARKEMRGVPHHLLDVVSPKKQFTVAEYVKLARKAIEDILARGKVPILCGGTGFYIDALLGTTTLADAPPDETLRKKLEKKPTESLFKQLKKLDPTRAKTIDPHNRRRLIRALEIVIARKHAGFTPACAKALAGRQTLAEKNELKYNALKIGLAMPDKQLQEKISMRIFVRISRGMIAEARRLHEKGLSWKRMEELGLEYRFLARYLKVLRRSAFLPHQSALKKEMIEQLKTASWHYARRQKTWFKRDKNIKWFEPNEYRKIKKVVNDFLKS